MSVYEGGTLFSILMSDEYMCDVDTPGVALGVIVDEIVDNTSTCKRTDTRQRLMLTDMT